jgi:hypothetical protein
MIFEYALEPSLLSNWDRFQRLVGLFGVAQGRVISRYPKDWAKRVYETYPSGNTQKSKVEIALRRVTNGLLYPRANKWDDNLEWLPNAVAEHGRSPFHAILANGGHAADYIVDASDLDVTALPDLLKAGPSRIITRTADDMGRVVRGLLLLASKIVLVEPNFTIKSPRFRDPLAAILLAALDVQQRVRPSVEVELHMGADMLDQYGDKSASLTAFLADIIPVGMRLNVVTWHKDDLHNRYLITDRCGLQVGEGFGLPDDKSSRTDDVLTMMSDVTAGQLMEQYCKPKDAAKHLLRCRIVGIRKLSG